MMIESLCRITGRERTTWDCETLLIMGIHRDSMQQKAAKADCEQPYFDQLSVVEDLEDTNEAVVGSFFSRFKGK